MADAQPYTQSPVLEMSMAIICGAINFFLPGIGTITAGVIGAEKTIGRGIAQLLLALIVVGWIWAQVTSIQLLINASWQQKQQAPTA